MKKKKIAKGIKTAGVLFLVIMLSSLAGCMTNPTTGERRFNLMSMDQEIEMGREADDEISQTMGLYPDEPLQAYVSDIGLVMGESSEWPDLPWTFRVVDEATVNAFALPGGHIYVTRGILAHFNNEAQLAGVLGHEIGHVTARHTSIRMSKMQVAQLGVGLAVVIDPELQRIAPLAGVGIQLLFLSFSRTDENESDELGVRYMTTAGYDPEALIGVMETLRNVSAAGDGKRLPEWQATHPYPENRQENIRSHIRNLEPQKYRSDGRDNYLNRIDGIVFGKDPREGYSRDGIFYHPELLFSLHFPDGWNVINQKQAVVSISEQRDASVQLSISREASIDTAAQQFYSIKQIAGKGITRTRINGLSAGVGVFQAQSEQGNIEGSVVFIEYAQQIYQLIGYSGIENWLKYREMVNASIRSFAALTDRHAIEMVPLRIRVVHVDQTMTLRRFYDSYYKGSTPPVPLEQIALINQVGVESSLHAGTRLKMIR